MPPNPSELVVTMAKVYKSRLKINGAQKCYYKSQKNIEFEKNVYLHSFLSNALKHWLLSVDLSEQYAEIQTQ